MPQDEAVAAHWVPEGLLLPTSWQLASGRFVYRAEERTISSRVPCSVSLLGMLSTPRKLQLGAVVRHITLRLHAQHQLFTIVSASLRWTRLVHCVAHWHVRIFLVAPDGFGRFCTAAFGASPPMGRPSMSRTSRPDAIAALQGIESAMSEGCERALVMGLQGCREK
jgi:hypothetical protein